MTFHLISGLPRSGSTVLAAILRQNPDVHASIQSPLADIVASILKTVGTHECESFVSREQRRAMLAKVCEGYYSQREHKVVFDTNRSWCSFLHVIREVWPDSRVVCCVRNPAWILDSFERLIQRPGLHVPRTFGQEYPGTVFARVEMLSKVALGMPLQGLKQAWFSESAQSLVVVRYESLVAKPAKVVGALYELLQLPSFRHDYENVEFEAPEFDARLGIPGLHRVSGRVEAKARETILPPELFQRFNQEFWSGIGSNPRHVTIL